MGLQQRMSQARAVLGILHGSRALGGPVQAFVDVTGRCNIRCVHCYYYSPHTTVPNLPEVRLARLQHAELPDAQAMKARLHQDADGDRMRGVLDTLLDMGTRRFQFSGNGEAFLHPELMEFIARVKSRNSYCVSNTNGTLLDRATMDRLIELGFDELRVSILSGTRDSYARTHPGIQADTFDRMCENFRYMAERKRAAGAAKPALSLVTVIMSHTADDLMNLAHLADDLDAQYVNYRIIDDVNDPNLRQLALNDSQQKEAYRQLGEAACFLSERGIGNNALDAQPVLNRQLDTTEFYRIVPCYYGWLMSRINVDGDVRPCCRCYHSMGNAFEVGFRAVWHGEAYRRFRREALRLPRRDRPPPGCDCTSCVHHHANLRVFKALHPLNARRVRSRISPLLPGGDDE